jgi:hypothetical protein
VVTATLGAAVGTLSGLTDADGATVTHPATNVPASPTIVNERITGIF